MGVMPYIISMARAVAGFYSHIWHIWLYYERLRLLSNGLVVKNDSASIQFRKDYYSSDLLTGTEDEPIRSLPH
jgi:hypothetical protein